MKTLNGRGQIASFFVTLMASMSLLTACGGSFHAGPQSADLRPPATSAPKIAQDQRQWEATQQAQTQVEPLLQTQSERESFFQDVTEQKPSYTDDQLVDDAELQFQETEKKHKTKKPHSNANSSNSQRDDSGDSQDSLPPVATDDLPADGSGVAAPPAGTSTAKKPTAPKPPTAAKPKTPAKPKAPTQQQQAAKPTAPAKPPDATIQTDFCDQFRLSGSGAADLSDLYNNDAKLATSMLTRDLKAASGQTKQSKFVCIVLPIAVRMDEEVYRQRIEILRLQAKQKKNIALTADDQTWLSSIRTSYGLAAKDSYDELLKRVDIVPLPLLLAQAALESGWGTSRAAHDLNNLFGIHATKGQPCKTGYDTHNAFVRQYTYITESVSDYVRLLNSGSYYSKFRDARTKMRSNGQALDSVKLLSSLGNYNETPVAYIKTVRQVMTGSSRLTQFVFKENEVQEP